MKQLKRIQLNLMFFFLFGILNTTQAQVVDTVGWCPAGATWTYYNGHSLGSAEYMKLTYEKDTIIDGYNSKKLALSYISIINGATNPTTNYYRSERAEPNSPEFYYESNDSIYWYNKNDEFQFIYDFGAVAGDEWTITNGEAYSCAIPLGLDTFICDSIKTKEYDGRVFEVTYGSMVGTKWELGEHIIKNIGSSNNPYPLAGDTCNNSQGTGGTANLDLSCYYDDIRGFVDFRNNSRSCNTIINPIDKINNTQEQSKSNWAVYPNPTSTSIHVELLDYQPSLEGIRIQYEIYNISGQRLYQAIGSVNETININTFANGMYFLTLFDEKGKLLLSQKIIKQ